MLAENKVQIAGLQKSSLVDYPSKIAAVIFTLSCNFRCHYCHNPNILTAVSSNKLFEEAAVFDFLETRKGKLDAVVVSGGEPTLQKDIAGFFKKLKEMDFLTKLDTNGTNPQVLELLIKQKLVDYVAMDIKAPLEKYQDIVATNIDTNKIHQSISILKNADIPYEFRTTTVKSQLSYADFEKIGLLIKGAPLYYLQKFKSDTTLNPNFSKEKTYSDEEFLKIKAMLQTYIKTVCIR